MQIQPNLTSTAATSAAASVSQASSKDRTTGGATDAAATTTNGVERIARAEASHADRDAQGGGEGLPPRNPTSVEDELSIDDQTDLPLSPLDPPTDPPSLLDIVG